VRRPSPERDPRTDGRTIAEFHFHTIIDDRAVRIRPSNGWPCHTDDGSCAVLPDGVGSGCDAFGLDPDKSAALCRTFSTPPGAAVQSLPPGGTVRKGGAHGDGSRVAPPPPCTAV